MAKQMSPEHAIAKEHKMIMKDLKTNMVNGKQKKKHWIWWIFPSAKAGQSDPHKVTQTLSERVDFFNSKSIALEYWKDIITLIAAICEEHSIFKVFPKVDHGRINGYIDSFFSPYALSHSIPAAVINAMERLRNAWVRWTSCDHAVPRKSIKPSQSAPCKYWLQGYCKNGYRCQFAHQPTHDVAKVVHALILTGIDGAAYRNFDVEDWIARGMQKADAETVMAVLSATRHIRIPLISLLFPEQQCI